MGNCFMVKLIILVQFSKEACQLSFIANKNLGEKMEKKRK